jgi:hypothetical protein
VNADPAHGQLEPTTSAFDGPYYALTSSCQALAAYTLTLRIDPPHEARHLEYQRVWLHPHTLVEHLVWNSAS